MSIYKLDLPRLELTEVSALKPRGRQVIVIPLEIPEIQESSGEHGASILVAMGDNNGTIDMRADRYPTKFGKVLFVGPEVPEDIQPGDIVYFHKHSGQDGDTLEGTFLQIDSENIQGHASCKYRPVLKTEENA